MADYEEQARAIALRAELDTTEELTAAIADFARTAAEDATRRERAKAQPVIDAARAECAKFSFPDEDRPELHAALQDYDATPPPPRPATGDPFAQQYLQRCADCGRDMFTRDDMRHHCPGRESPTPPATATREARCDHTGIGLPGCMTCDPRTVSEGGPRPDPAPTPPTRTEDGGRCECERRPVEGGGVVSLWRPACPLHGEPEAGRWEDDLRVVKAAREAVRDWKGDAVDSALSLRALRAVVRETDPVLRALVEAARAAEEICDEVIARGALSFRSFDKIVAMKPLLRAALAGVES